MRTIVRTVLIVLTIIGTLLFLYLLRRPAELDLHRRIIRGGLFRPINLLSRQAAARRGDRAGATSGSSSRRSVLAAVFVPPVVNQAADLADNAPKYAQDLQDFVNKNKQLRKLGRTSTTSPRRSRTRRQSSRPSFRTPPRPSRPRVRGGELRVHGGDDPVPEHLHGRQRRGAGLRAFLRTRPPDQAERLERTHPADRRRRRQLRRRGGAAGDDRRGDDLRRAEHPWRAVRRTPGGGRRSLRPPAAGRRDHRRGVLRARHRVATTFRPTRSSG